MKDYIAPSSSDRTKDIKPDQQFVYESNKCIDGIFIPVKQYQRSKNEWNSLIDRKVFSDTI